MESKFCLIGNSHTSQFDYSKMNVLSIPIKQVTVSILNVRKQITCNEDEEGSIIDLANNIKINWLLNPLTVRFVNDEYEVIAGQRRYMAIKLLEWDTVPCNVMNVDNQKAKELSLVENIQRNQMTTADKVRAYSRLYEVYNKFKTLKKCLNNSSIFLCTRDI